MDENNGIPAWLVCEDMLTKLKTELITQAMETLQEAIDSKAIEINGSLVTLPDRPSDTDMSLFIINKMIEQKGEIYEEYKGFLASNKGSTDPKIIQQKERLERFLLSVERISTLMGYSRVFDSWLEDVGMQATLTDPSEVIKATLHNNEQRSSVLKYVLSNKRIKGEKILSENEREILNGSLQS